jgi:hypothetical protein
LVDYDEIQFKTLIEIVDMKSIQKFLAEVVPNSRIIRNSYKLNAKGVFGFSSEVDAVFTSNRQKFTEIVTMIGVRTLALSFIYV